MMKVRVFTLRLDPESGLFDDHLSREFQEGHDLIDVSEHVFTRDGAPVLALVVRYHEPDTARGRRTGEAGSRGERHAR